MQDMVKNNYKKVAMGKSPYPGAIFVKKDKGKIYTIPLNLTFKPQTIFLRASGLGASNADCYIRITIHGGDFQLYDHKGGYAYIHIVSMSKEKIEIRIDESNAEGEIIYLLEWVAIE